MKNYIRIKLEKGKIWFEPRTAAVEPCVYAVDSPDGLRVGAGWLDISEFKGTVPVEISTKPKWNIVAAIRIAQDVFRELDKAGPKGAPMLARLSVTSPDYWSAKIDNRSRIGQAARDIFILLMLPFWEKQKWTHAQRAVHLNATGRWFNKIDGEANWRALADRTSDLVRIYKAK
jgi:hypothetical protein